MAASGSSKQERANARAKALGYRNDYDRRIARAYKEGFTSLRERANARARARGFVDAKSVTAFRKTGATSPKQFQRDEVLRYFDITLYKFNKVRAANREYGEGAWSKFNSYNYELDGQASNWSVERVGYILSYHAALVNPKTNWYNLQNQPMGSRNKDGSLRGVKVANASQYYYLVKYTNLMEQDEYESRYGMNSVREASKGKVKP